jgi:hypothetical protein
LCGTHDVSNIQGVKRTFNTQLAEDGANGSIIGNAALQLVDDDAIAGGATMACWKNCCCET